MLSSDTEIYKVIGRVRLHSPARPGNRTYLAFLCEGSSRANAAGLRRRVLLTGWGAKSNDLWFGTLPTWPLQACPFALSRCRGGL